MFHGGAQKSQRVRNFNDRNAGERALAPPTARGKRALENAQMYYTSVEDSRDLIRDGSDALQRFVQPGLSGDILTGVVWGLGVASAVSFTNDLFEDYLQPVGRQKSKEHQRRWNETPNDEGLLPKLNFFGGGGSGGNVVNSAVKQGGGQGQRRQDSNLSNEVWRMHLLPRRLRNEAVVTVVQFRTGKLDVRRACCKNTTELLLPRRRPTLCRRRTACVKRAAFAGVCS